jgi:citrate synthase
MIIRDKIAAQLPEWRARKNRLMKDHGYFKVGDVTVEQIYGGIRGVQVQVSDISYVDPDEGIRLRGFTIPEILEKLPKFDDAEYPMMGGLYYLLMVGELPTYEEAMLVEDEWKARSEIPQYVYDVLRSVPENTHPMTMFSIGVMLLQNLSAFANGWVNGLKKEDYWELYLEDSLDLTARVPGLAAYIYNLKYRNGEIVPINPDLDWGANFAYMIGKGDDKAYQDLARLFFLLHSDHEGGNVSAHTSALVASALSDIYLASSAGLNGLAGPLHGLANQECLRWLLLVRDAFTHFPSRAELEAWVWDYINSGQVVPGYGHAVLRKTDPRFTAQLEFGKKFLPDDELLKLVILVSDVVPGVLQQLGKVKNPWPNVDAINGALQYHFGVSQFDFYTVLFGVSRISGFTAHAVWSRALMKPIERPKSLTTKMLEEMIENSVLLERF